MGITIIDGSSSLDPETVVTVLGIIIKYGSTSLATETVVTVLGGTTDDNLSFDEHIRAKATRQLNVLVCIVKYIDVQFTVMSNSTKTRKKKYKN